MNNLNKNIAIDIRWMLGRVRGMGRYAFQLVDAIKYNVIGVGPHNCVCERLPYKAVGNGFFPWWEQFVLPKYIKENNIQRVICPYNTAPIRKLDAQLILVVHDLIYLKSWKELPPSVSLYQTLGRIYRRFVVPRVIRNADVLLTVSDFTKYEMVARFDLNPESIYVIPNSVNKSWYVDCPVSLENRGSYCLTVAGEAPSKNVKRLIKAFALVLPKLPVDFKLKIVGVNVGYQSKFNKLIIEKNLVHRVEFVAFITDEDLKKLYQNAQCFIFPSLFEGFGIPLIEAMASGTPIACSNATSIPEVVGDAALLFDPLNELEMADAICKIVNEKDIARKLIENGLERSKLFKEENVKTQFEEFWKIIDEH